MKKKQLIILGIFLTLSIAGSFPLTIVNVNRIQENQDLGDLLKTSAWNPGFNYTMIDDYPYSWIEINTTGTNFTSFNMGLDDGCNATSFADQGWPFTFYGTEYDYLNVSTNGWMTFTNDNDPTAYIFDDEEAYDWADIPQNSSTTRRGNHNDTAILLGTDLDLSSGGSILYQFFGTAPNRYLVIEYYQVAEIETHDPQTMEAIFHENGDIHFQYKSITSPLGSTDWSYPNVTVGLEHGDLVNYNMYTNNWTQTFNNQPVASKSVYFKLSGSPMVPSLNILTPSPTTTTTISLEWTRSLFNPDNYTLYRHTAEINSGTLGSATEVKTITDNSTTDTVPGVGTWYYAVVAHNENGSSAPSNSPSIEVESSGGGGGGPIPGADIALISLSSLIAIVIIVRKFKKSKISKT